MAHDAKTVPFKIDCVWEGSIIEDKQVADKNYFGEKLSPILQSLIRAMIENQINENETDNDNNYGGWIADKDLTTFRKGKLVVRAINESEYNSVGECQLTFYADEKQILTKFLRDIEMNHIIKRISKNVPIVEFH